MLRKSVDLPSSRSAETEAPPAFLSTHPSDQQRQQRLGALASKMMPYYQAPGVRPTHPVRIGTGAA